MQLIRRTVPAKLRRLLPAAPSIALSIALLALLATASTAADYTFTDAGTIFGPLKDHFGRVNAWGDLDGDGRYDIITGSHDRGLRAFLQVTPLQFTRVDGSNGLKSPEPLYGILILDFDRDGDKDVFLNQIGFSKKVIPSSTKYYRNDGTGHFINATVASGASSYGFGFGLVALDYNRDGWVDVYVVNHHSANILFRNDGGTFTDVTAIAGVDALNGRDGRSTSATSLDFDRDGWMDLYVAQRDLPDADHPLGNSHLLRNQGDGTFVNIAEAAGVLGFGEEFVTDSADFNDDNWPDIHVATFNFGPNGCCETHLPNRTYLNNHDGTFTDITADSNADYAGGTMGLALFDHDNDGLDDIYIGTGGPFDLQIEDQHFYRNLGDAIFKDETVNKGLVDDARGHGNSAFDYDRDGDLDLFASLGGHTEGSEHRDILYLNNGGPAHWMEIQLIGDDCPLEGLGAVVTLYAEGIQRRKQVRAASGFNSFEPPHLWYGLGDLTAIDRLVIEWPCGRTEEVVAPAIDQHLQLREGASPLGIEDPGGLGSEGFGLRPESAVSLGEVQFVVSLPSTKPATISIYDLKGRLVREMVVSGRMLWDGNDLRGRSVAAGRYVAILRQDDRQTGSSLVLIR